MLKDSGTRETNTRSVMATCKTVNGCSSGRIAGTTMSGGRNAKNRNAKNQYEFRKQRDEKNSEEIKHTFPALKYGSSVKEPISMMAVN